MHHPDIPRWFMYFFVFLLRENISLLLSDSGDWWMFYYPPSAVWRKCVELWRQCQISPLGPLKSHTFLTMSFFIFTSPAAKLIYWFLVQSKESCSYRSKMELMRLQETGSCFTFSLSLVWRVKNRKVTDQVFAALLQLIRISISTPSAHSHHIWIP